MMLFEDVGTGCSFAVEGAPHYSTMRTSPYNAARDVAGLDGVCAARGIPLTAAEVEVLRDAARGGTYNTRYASASFKVAYERLWPEDRAVWDDRVSAGVPPEDILHELAALHQQFASTGRVFDEEGDAVEAADYYSERVADETSLLGVTLRKRLTFRVLPLGSRWIVRTTWSMGPRGGDVLPNAAKKFVAEVLMAWGGGSSPVNCGTTLLVELRGKGVLTVEGQEAAFAAAGFPVGARAAAVAAMATNDATTLLDAQCGVPLPAPGRAAHQA
jgi:hypothetical protein